MTLAHSQQWQVRIYLENGSTLDGFVKHDKFVEVFKDGNYEILPDRNKHIQRQITLHNEYTIPQDEQIENIGLRLWYTGHSDGYAYIPYTKVHKIVFFAKKDVLDKVNRQKERLEKYYNKKKKQQRKERQQRQERKNIEFIEERREELQAVRDKLASIKLTQRQKDLLEEFPPGPEWSHEERDEIHAQLNYARNNFTVRYIDGRKVIQKDRFGGVNKKEREFYEKYNRWAIAFEKKQKIEKLQKRLQLLEQIHGVDSDKNENAKKENAKNEEKSNK